MIQVENVGFSVAGKLLLQDVSFPLRAGEVLAVCGPNGAGKSTLLKCLAGQIAPATGHIRVHGRPLRDYGTLAARWRAVLPQFGAIPFDFTVREIVLFGRSPHPPGNRARDLQIADAALELADVSSLADRTVTTLSGGEMQRVHLARVLAQVWEPAPETGRLLLLDEPTSALDLRHQHLVLQIARHWAAQGTAVLAILHDLNLAATYADTLLLLHRGKTAALGPPETVLEPNVITHVFDIPVLVGKTPHGTPHVFANPAPHFIVDRTADTLG